MKSKKVRIGLVHDAFTNDPEAEKKTILGHFNHEVGHTELKFAKNDVNLSPSEKDGIDVLVIDYGGVGMGAESATEWQIRMCLEWAEEHPGKPMAIWTDHTAWVYERTLQEEFGLLNNVLIRYSDNEEEFWNELRRWV